MNNISNLKIHIGPIAENRWLAATSQAPYFCIEAESRDALLVKARSAVAFCREASEYIADVVREREQIQPFVFTETLSARELEDA